MGNVRVAFEVLPDGKSASKVHQFLQFQMVLDIKMEDFRQKAKLVAGDHMIKAWPTIMHVSIVLREMARITLMTATLNDCDVNLGNILNAYVQVHVTEKGQTTLGPDFGKDARKTAVIIRDLNSLKSAGATFRSHLTRDMKYLGYESCKAYLNLCHKPEIRPKDEVQYYSYLLCYADDILCIHHDVDAMLK